MTRKPHSTHPSSIRALCSTWPIPYALLAAGVANAIAVKNVHPHNTHTHTHEQYAGALLGLTNFTGAVGGSLGVYLTGVLVDKLGDWNLAFLGPSSLMLVLGAATYTFLCK